MAGNDGGLLTLSSRNSQIIELNLINEFSTLTPAQQVQLAHLQQYQPQPQQEQPRESFIDRCIRLVKKVYGHGCFC